jgi:hypothetical protein
MIQRRSNMEVKPGWLFGLDKRRTSEVVVVGVKLQYTLAYMSKEYKRQQSFPLRLSPSIRRQANDLAHEDGLSLNHFISLAIAEKVTRMEQQSRAHQHSQAKQYSMVASRFKINKLNRSERPAQ